MKRPLSVVLAGLIAASSLAFAQSESVLVEPFVGGGVALGVPGGDPSLTLQGGAANLLRPLALRGVFEIDLDGVASLGADLITYFPTSLELAPYVGGGLALALTFPAYEVHAVGGLEYFVNSDASLFAEVQPAYRIFADIDDGLGANVRLGANYRWD
jgi:hypothetical protein